MNYLLTALSRKRKPGQLLDQIQSAFILTEQSFLSEKSLWHRKRPTKREKSAPVLVEEEALGADALSAFTALLDSRYGKIAVREFVERLFGNADVWYSKDIPLESDDNYILSLLAVLNSQDRGSFYVAEVLDGEYVQGAYHIPQVRFVRKGGP